MSDRLKRWAGDELVSGLNLDQPSQSAILWETGSNVIFRGRSIRPFPGGASLFPKTTDKVITGILDLSARVEGKPSIVFGTDADLRIWNQTDGQTIPGTGYTGRQDDTVAGLIASRWSIVQWNDWIIATNGKDLPQIYKTTSFGNLNVSTLFTTCEIFLKWRQFLIGFNLSDGGNHIRWPNLDNPEDWTPTASNRAGGIYAQDANDIKAAVALGESILFYDAGTAHQLEYLGGNDVFGSHKLLEGIGAVGKNAVCEAIGRHWGVGSRGLWVSDGAAYEYIDNPMVRDYFRGRLNTEQQSKVVCYNDLFTKHVVIFFPGTTSLENNEGIAFNYEDKFWTKISFGRSCAADNGIFSYAVAGGTNGDVFAQSLNTVISAEGGNPNMPIDVISAQIISGFGELGFGNGGFGGTTNVAG
jgi:hypothetical protein